MSTRGTLLDTDEDLHLDINLDQQLTATGLPPAQQMDLHAQVRRHAAVFSKEQVVDLRALTAWLYGLRGQQIINDVKTKMRAVWWKLLTEAEVAIPADSDLEEPAVQTLVKNQEEDHRSLKALARKYLKGAGINTKGAMEKLITAQLQEQGVPKAQAKLAAQQETVSQLEIKEQSSKEYENECNAAVRALQNRFSDHNFLFDLILGVTPDGKLPITK